MSSTANGGSKHHLASYPLLLRLRLQQTLTSYLSTLWREKLKELSCAKIQLGLSCRRPEGRFARFYADRQHPRNRTKLDRGCSCSDNCVGRVNGHTMNVSPLTISVAIESWFENASR